MPLGVVVPRTATDVEATIAIAREHGVPVTARGGGTSQCGQTVNHGLIVDVSRYMRDVVALDTAARTRARAARHRARRAQPRLEEARAVLPGRSVDREPRDDRRHDGQQQLRRALDPLRHHGRQRRRHRRRACRRHARVFRRGERARRWRCCEWCGAPGGIASWSSACARSRRARRARSRRASPRCSATWAATRSTPCAPTATSTWRSCWSARKARSRSSPRSI